MPDVSGPFDSAAFAQSSWYRDRGYLEPSGVQGAPTGTLGGGDLGWSSNGLTSSLAIGRAHVRGAYYERTSTAYTYTHPANTTANPRIDTIALRRDLAAKTVVPAVLQGTPAASPSAVALTQVDNGVWEEALFDVTVPANSGTVLTAVDRRQNIVAGQPDSGWSAMGLTNPLTGFAAWRRKSGVVDVHCDLSYNGAYSVNFVMMNVPAGARPQWPRRIVGMTYGGAPFFAFLNTNGDLAVAVAATASGVWLDFTYTSA